MILQCNAEEILRFNAKYHDSLKMINFYAILAYPTRNLFDVPLADINHHSYPFTENDYTTNDTLQQIEEGK